MTIKRVTECSLELEGSPVRRQAVQVGGRGHVGSGFGGGMAPPPAVHKTAVAKWSVDADVMSIHQDSERIELTAEQFRTLVEASDSILSDLVPK